MQSTYEYTLNQNEDTDEEIGVTTSSTTQRSSKTLVDGDGDKENDNKRDCNDDVIKERFQLIESLAGSRAVR